MTAWLALRLIGLGGWFKRAIGGAIAWAVKNPALAIIIASMLGNVWLWHGWDAEKSSHKADNARCLKKAVDVQKKAEAAAAAALAANQDISKENAHVQVIRVAADTAAADRYIAVHRIVRQPDTAPASGAGGGAALPVDPAPGADMVATEAVNIRTCTADYDYAKGAYDLIQSWIAQGNAVPATPEPDHPNK